MAKKKAEFIRFNTIKEYINDILKMRSSDDAVNKLIKDVDSAIEATRCSDYRVKLVLVKWRALRRTRAEIACIAALERQLLKEYGNDPMVASILLSRATELLAGQDYAEAVELINQIQEEFPSTKAAQQAKNLLERANAMGGVK